MPSAFAAALREVILTTDASIGEEIFWNAPTFFYTGEMKPFDPKEYKRYIIVLEEINMRKNSPSRSPILRPEKR